MNIDITNFNPTYKEAEHISSEYYLLLGALEDSIERKILSEEELEEMISQYHDLKAFIELLNYSIKYSSMTTKIRKFDNQTLESFKAQRKVARAESEMLLRYYNSLIRMDNVSDEDIDTVLSKYENKLDEVRELSTKIDYIESNYKVDVSSK